MSRTRPDRGDLLTPVSPTPTWKGEEHKGRGHPKISYKSLQLPPPQFLTFDTFTHPPLTDSHTPPLSGRGGGPSPRPHVYDTTHAPRTKIFCDEPGTGGGRRGTSVRPRSETKGNLIRGWCGWTWGFGGGLLLVLCDCPYRGTRSFVSPLVSGRRLRHLTVPVTDRVPDTVPTLLHFPPHLSLMVEETVVPVGP